jgi:hypothetical protein
MDECPERPPMRGADRRRSVPCPTAEDKQCMSVILAGAPWEATTVYGPFANSIEAGEYAEAYLWGQDFWWVVPMKREV